ncbi:PrsW family glutamic-type intramembrane protease [Streptomyces sp. RKCA744]|uniref:PrsW family glutamic-type intramembrane protease n=1 Tax=Streptomyces sp. RKCA744 TaxID=2959340 RepID=UPI0020A0ABE3|nr:PrsW family glutamic-type intramembrane protease [Streptomyces sp. RKCA744]MCO8303548.1 PrsW family glutamic-type intramembrane protease [Streptomyces sp. RKCA744]
MALVMVAATVYGVVQLLVLASPTRSVRVSTVLLAIAVGVYGCGVVTALLELAYTRSAADLTGEPLAKVVEVAGYTVDPVIEELIKLAPLLLVAWNVRIRRQWGMTDYVVLGSALGAGFGLLEAVARFGLDADRAIAHPAGGWAIPDSLRAPYIPGPEQILSAWFPAPSSTLELGDFSPAAETSPHLVYTALTALGVGVLLRGRGWVRALSPLPVAAAVSHHMLTNYAAARPADRDARSWADAFDGVLWTVPLLCLAIAVAADLRHIRRGKRLVPGILLQAERTGRSGLAALVAYGGWRVPWTTLIALRFARMRRSLLYAAARPAYPGAEALHQSVAWAAGQIDASDNAHAWRHLDFHAVHGMAGAVRDRHRKWFVLISIGLAAPALVFLCVGSFPAAATLQERFGSGNGPYVLMAFGVAGLLWMGWQLIALLRTWQTTRAVPHGELLAVARFRIWTALGGLTTGAVLLLRLRDGLEPDKPLIRNLHLLEALDNFLAYLGFALLLMALLALLPSGGGLALATAGAGGGLVTVPAVIHAAAFGALGIVLMSASAAGDGGGGSPNSEGSEGPVESSGQGRVRRGKEYEDHLQEKLGGRGSFREGGREFDGAYLGDDGIEVWYEAKSGRYWDLANENPKVMEKFKSNLGDARRISEESGRRFSLISEKPIPENIVKWLNKKNYVWRVISKEAG